MGQPPNFLVVVFDALRASDFPGGSEGVAEMPFVRSLQRTSWVFPNAVAPGSWTLPSHASLLTGLYPWEHGAHGRGSLSLDPQVPRLSELLKARGYRTALLASNTFLAPPYGLADGFDLTAWGAWWEHYFRVPSHVPPFQREGGKEEARGAFAARMGELREGGGQVFGRATHHLDRFPWVADLVGRLALKILLPEAPREVRFSTWIEPTLARWMARGGAESPFFAVLNIQDTHEPFFPGPEEATSFLDRWRLLRVRQDLLGALVGRWTPTPEALHVLREMYRWTVRRLDVRVRTLVEMLQRLGRWDRTWLILTSDHGQAFGEEGRYLHFCGISEGIQRIPLWVRPPADAGGGTVARGLASLIDIMPTILSEAGSSARGGPAGVDLHDLLDRERPAPVLSFNDGLFWDHMVRWARGPVRDRLARPQVAAYQGRLRLTVTSAEPSIQLDELPAGTGPPRRWSEPLPPEAIPMKEAAERALRRALGSAPPRSPDTERRLRSWGYV